MRIRRISLPKSPAKCKGILLPSVHDLRPVSQDGHAAGKQHLNNKKLQIAVILHLIHHQMLDILMLTRPKSRYFK